MAHVATTLVQAIRDTKEPIALEQLAGALSAVAARMEGKGAPAATSQAVATFLPVMKDTKDPGAFLRMAIGLEVLATQMEAKDAAQAGATIVEAMKDTKDPFALQSQARVLSALAAHMEAEGAATVTAPAATILTYAIKNSRDAGQWKEGLSPTSAVVVPGGLIPETSGSSRPEARHPASSAAHPLQPGGERCETQTAPS